MFPVAFLEPSMGEEDNIHFWGEYFGMRILRSNSQIAPPHKDKRSVSYSVR